MVILLFEIFDVSENDRLISVYHFLFFDTRTFVLE